MEPCFDPSDPLDAVESSVERLSEPVDPLLGNPDRFMDDLARQLGDVEQSAMSAMRLPPSEPDESLAPRPASAGPLVPTGAGTGSAGPGPFPDSAQEQQSQIELKPERAAVPFFRSDGITASRHTLRRGGGTGIRSSGGASAGIWCEPRKANVSLMTCLDCPEYSDHGSGYQECYYEWAEANGE